MVICLFILFCAAACNTAMRDGAKSATLKAGMSNTLTLSKGEVVYDLNGEWSIETNLSGNTSYNGLATIKQEGDRFVAVLTSGNYPHAAPLEKVKGTLKGAGISKIQLYTIYGWVNSFGEIEEAGNRIILDTQLPEIEANTTLTRK